MKKLFYLILFFPIFMIGQSSGNISSQKESVSVHEKKMSVDKTAGFIWNNFNKPTINAYQNRALDKLKEFYSYLILLQTTDDSELQNQLQLTIKGLLFDDRVNFQNFIDVENKKYTIDELLTQVVQKKIVFFMPIIYPNAYLNHNDFEFSLTLKVEVNKQLKQLNVNQKVFLGIDEKTFGNEKKLVWNLKLGGF